MIVVRLRGGLGNQLFMYAAARRLAVVNSVPLKLDTISGFKWDSCYNRVYLLNQFNIEADMASRRESCLGISGRIRRNLMRRINKRLQYDRKYYITEEGGAVDPRFLRLDVKHKIYLEGYWQSDRYFKDIEDVIRKDLEVTAELDPLTLRESEVILEKEAVCIGIRKYEEEKGIFERPVLDIRYYLKAMEMMVKRVPSAHFFIITEAPEWVKRNLDIQYPFTFISHKEGNENAYKNMWLMSLCKHFIVSQGSYHWWGAWLSKNADKVVIAPEPRKLKLAEDYFPETWIKIGY